MTAPSSIQDLIDQWPTITAFAEAIGCGYEAARKMHKRDKIASDHWARVVDACERKGVEGVTFSWLARVRDGSFGESSLVAGVSGKAVPAAVPSSSSQNSSLPSEAAATVSPDMPSSGVRHG